MTRQKWILVLLSFVVLTVSSVSYSQTPRTVKRSVAAVLFSTLGGAILGLSTLSFYGDPQEHTNNISLGAIIGFVGGVGYVAYDSARPTAISNDYSQSFEETQKKERALAVMAKAPLLVRIDFDF